MYIIITSVKGKVLWKKSIPFLIAFLFLIVAFSPISFLNDGTSTAHEQNAGYNTRIDQMSINSTSLNSLRVLYTLALSNGSLLNGNVASIFSRLSPYVAAYDPTNQYLYVVNSLPNELVSNSGPGSVTVISSATDKVVQNITVGYFPTSIEYDPANQYMYVANSISGNISVINSATDRIVQSINIGYGPTSIEYDPANQYMYVANSSLRSTNVVVINSSTDNIVQNITVGEEPTSIEYDPANQYMYVENSNSNYVTVINSSTDNIVQNITVGLSPVAAEYDPANQYMYIVNLGSGSLSIIGNKYTVPFTESGLPSGTTWYVHLIDGRTLSSTSSTIFFTSVNDSYFYSIGHVYGYSSTPIGGQVIVMGNSVQVSVVFSRNVAPLWAFDGEYVNYTAFGMNFTKPVSGYAYEEISGVNTNYGTINTSTIGHLKGYTFSSQYENNTSWNDFFNAYNSTDLSLLNQGKIPASVSESNGSPGTISAGVPLTTGMGTYLTDRLDFTINTTEYQLRITLYVDQYSGLLIGYTYSVGPVNITLLLQSTNINLSSGSSMLRINVSPSDASVTVNGIHTQTTSGSASLSLSPGSYYVSVSSNGYVPELIQINMTSGRTEYLNVTLTRSTSPTYTISGYVSPGNASVVVDGYSADVNDTGYYSISLPNGTYVLSVTDTGYYSSTRNVTLTSNMSDLNFTLVKEPAPTSTKTLSDITATGYNVTVSNVVSGNGSISVNYTATSNGTLTVVLPYSQVKNATISDLLSSRLYINGTQYRNFSVAIASSDGSYSVILTVHNLTGDPTLVWLYSPLASLPSKPPSSISNSEIFAIIGAVVVVVVIVGIAMAMIKKK